MLESDLRSQSSSPRCCGSVRRAGRPSLASDPWRPVVRDLRDSDVRGRRVAHGPSRHGGRDRGYGCNSVYDEACHCDAFGYQPLQHEYVYEGIK